MWRQAAISYLKAQHVLELSVLVWVLPQKMAKVKATNRLSFPLKLDLGHILAMAGAELAASLKDGQYDLMSILIHKGPSASHGHYGEPQNFCYC